MKMGNNRDIYCYANWEVVNFERAYQPLPPGTKISVLYKLNKIHVVDSPFDKDFKNIIFLQGGPNFGGGTARKFSENGQQQGHLLLCKLGGGEFRKSISAPTPWYQNPCDASIFLHARPNLSKK